MEEKPIVIITGASRGIGAATALAFAQRGYYVTLVATNAELLNSVSRHVAASGAEILSLAGDIADLQFCESVVQQTVGKWGRVDVLVNNAAWREVATMRTISLENWEKQFESASQRQPFSLAGLLCIWKSAAAG